MKEEAFVGAGELRRKMRFDLFQDVGDHFEGRFGGTSM